MRGGNGGVGNGNASQLMNNGIINLGAFGGNGLQHRRKLYLWRLWRRLSGVISMAGSAEESWRGGISWHRQYHLASHQWPI